MSLSWPERLKIAIGPSGVDVLRVGTTWSAGVRELKTVQYSRDAGETRNEAAIAALRAALDPVRRRARTCSIVLGSAFARYALLPWRDEVVDASACQAYAQAYLANTYGAAAEGWEVIRDEAAYGAPTAICALDRELLAGVRSAVHEAGLKLASLQPFFSAAFNYCRPRMKERDLWFALVEPERICLAQVAGRSLRRLRSQRVGDDVGVELAAMAERESLASQQAFAHGRLYVFAPGMHAGRFDSLHRLEAETYLLPFAGDPRYAMALA